MKKVLFSKFFLKIVCYNLVIICLLVGITTTLFYRNTQKQLESKLISSYSYSLEQISYHMQSLVSNYKDLSSVLLLSNRSNNSPNPRDFYSDKDILQLLQNISIVTDNIDHVYYYSVHGKVYDSGNGRSLELKKSYEELLQACQEGHPTFADGSVYWIYGIRENALSAFKLVKDIDSMQAVGILEMTPNPQIFDSIVKNLGSSNYDILLTDSKNNILFKKNPDSIFSRNHNLIWESVSSRKEDSFEKRIDGKGYYFLYRKMTNPDWTLLISISSDEVNASISKTTQGVLFVSFLIALLCIFISILLSYGMTTPLRKLRNVMKEVEKGNLEVQIHALPKDEIGDLGRSFNHMVKNLKVLIDEVYVQKLIRKESELEALQAQINPHFLYNTLESINCIAEIKGVQEISRMIKTLAQLMRSTISDKKETITLGEELDNINKYIYLQNIRFGGKINPRIQCADCLKDARIPKLILQPLVENAILHGLEQKIGSGSLSLDIQQSEETLLISISDDGIGFDVDSMVFRNSGLGVKNVDKRIKILFGEEYGISIDSRVGSGTDVTVRLPYRHDMYPDIQKEGVLHEDSHRR